MYAYYKHTVTEQFDALLHTVYVKASRLSPYRKFVRFAAFIA